MNSNINKIFYSDNIDVINAIQKSSIDLIYLDPPFNSNRNYKYTDYASQIELSNKPLAFTDIWSVELKSDIELKEYIQKIFTSEYDNDFIAFASNIFMAIFYSNKNMLGYIIFLTIRLYKLRDMLKDSGSIFLHCDPTSSHYTKIIMDAIFGSSNYRNEIVWHYDGPQGPSSKKLSTKHDIIFWYVKNIDVAKINKEYLYENIVVEENKLKSSGYRQDEQGRWFYDLPRGSYTDESIERLEREGRIRRTKNNKVRIKYFLETDSSGAYIRKKKISDVWSDILSLGLASSSEKNGYPTQKPLSLLERIIRITTDDGDRVFDPFLGSGTTIVASEHLGRKWCGVDESMLSMNTVCKRISDEFEYLIIDKDYSIIGLPSSRQDFLDLINCGKAVECKYFLLNKLGASILNNGKEDYISGYIGKMPVVINTDESFDIEMFENIITSISKKNNDTSEAICIIVFANISENIYNGAAEYEQSKIKDCTKNKVQILTLDNILLGNTFENYKD